jgi:hypothetical protein
LATQAYTPAFLKPCTVAQLPAQPWNQIWMSETRPQLNPCIIDTTLREGAQAPGVQFGEEESAEIAPRVSGY